MYIARQQLSPPTLHQVSIIQTIKMALAGSGTSRLGRGPTIYVRTTEDLAASNGTTRIASTSTHSRPRFCGSFEFDPELVWSGYGSGVG